MTTRQSVPRVLGLFAHFLFALLLSGCASGKKWVNAPLRAPSGDHGIRLMDGSTKQSRSDEKESSQQPVHSINAPPKPLTEEELADASSKRPSLKLQGEKRLVKPGPLDGQLLGVFRNCGVTVYLCQTVFVDDGKTGH
jgi:hypothetical protein